MKSTTKYLIAVVAVVLVIAAIAAFGMMSKPAQTQQDAESAQTASTSEQASSTPSANAGNNAAATEPQKAENPAPAKTEEPIVMPTFMYFISPKDASVDAAKAAYETLSAEYGDRVKFELKDVEAEPDLKERFMINQEDSPIPMKTPTLIMLDVHNNISTIGLSECTDVEVLRKAIEKALAA